MKKSKKAEKTDQKIKDLKEQLMQSEEKNYALSEEVGELEESLEEIKHITKGWHYDTPINAVQTVSDAVRNYELVMQEKECLRKENIKVWDLLRDILVKNNKKEIDTELPF